MNNDRSLISVDRYLEIYKKSDLSEVAFFSGFDPVDKDLKDGALFDERNHLKGVSILVKDGQINAYFRTAVGHIDVSTQQTNLDFKGAGKTWPVLFLYDLGVDKKSQGKSIGTSLLLRVFEQLIYIKDELLIGIAGVFLFARPDDDIVRFYLNRGFKFLEQKDEKDFGTGEEQGFIIQRDNEIPMYIPIVGIRAQLNLYGRT